MNADNVILDLVHMRKLYQIAETIGTGDRANSAMAEIRNPRTDERFLIRVERVSGPGPHTMQADLAVRALIKLLEDEWPANTPILAATECVVSHNVTTDELSALRTQVGNQTIAEFLAPCKGYPRCRCIQEGATTEVEPGNTSKGG